MKATATYTFLLLGVIVQAQAYGRSACKEICLHLSVAGKNQGDGGVDVTGAPNSESVEGADFGQLSSFSGMNLDIIGQAVLEQTASSCYNWGLQFWSSR